MSSKMTRVYTRFAITGWRADVEAFDDALEEMADGYDVLISTDCGSDEDAEAQP